MNNHGIYILANDAVLDQLIALINSIEANVSPTIPICIIPYDDRLTQVKQAIAHRSQISIFTNTKAIKRWELFAQDVWAAHPKGSQKSSAAIVNVRKHAQRRYAAFDGEFEKFVVYDADCLAMKPLDEVFAKLEQCNFVFDDWEHSKPEQAAALKFAPIQKALNLTPEAIRTQIHCSSFFGSKRGLFDRQGLAELKKKLIEHQEVEWINNVAEAFLFSYLTLRGEHSLFNFTLSPNPNDRTGNCADADHFININNRLYNQEGRKPIYRLHYMNYAANDFARLTKGEDVPIQYRDEFLHYRFLHHPEQRPQHLKKPSTIVELNRVSQKLIKKVQRVIA